MRSVSLLCLFVTACGGGFYAGSNAQSNRTWNGVDDGASWTPPRGIPSPEFCIRETVPMSCAGCTQVTDPPPEDLAVLAPGTVVTLTEGFGPGGELTIGGVGTAIEPIFVRGPGPDAPVVINRPVEILGSYIIVEYIEFDLGEGPDGIRLEGDHLCLRHSEVHSMDPGRNSTVVFVSNSDHVVLWDNHIHDNGDFSFRGEQDVHGVGAGNTFRIWILDNLIHHNRGDSMQFGHQADNTVGDIWIGRNELHSDGENCVDIKEASNVVVSENLLHHPAPGMPAVVFHDCPINAAAIYNEFFGSETGLSMASLEANCDDDQPVSLFVLRNHFHDIAGEAVQGWNGGKIYYVTGNSFTTVGTPIAISGEDPASRISESDDGLTEAFGAFLAIYGIDITG